VKRTRHIKYYLAATVALATFAVYLSALHNGFVDWDDGWYVFENPHIRVFNKSFFKWAFFESQNILWHPLTWISHAVDYALWGLDPVGHHLSSVLFHGLNTMLVVLLVMRLFEAWGAKHGGGDPGGSFSERGMLLVSAITGLLFGLHPIHVESVAWVTERKDVLYSFFFLLSLLSYLRYGARADEREEIFFKDSRYLACLGLFLLALLSKPMAITLPLVLLIIDWYPLERFGVRARLKKIVLEKIPFFAFSLLTVVITLMPNHVAPVLNPMENRPFLTRVLVGAAALISYLGKMLWPVQLVPFYPYPRDVSFWSPTYFVPLLLVIAITIACVAVSRTRKIWLALWAYYIATLFPVLGFVTIGNHAMADRYTYLPSLSPFIILGLTAAWASGKADGLAQSKMPIKVFSAMVAVLAVVSLAQLTIRQIGIWKDSFTLWNYVINKEPEGAYLAYNGLGVAFQKTGRFDEAIEDFNRAIAIAPFFDEAFFNRGIAYEKMGRLDKAIADYTTTIALNPSYYEAYTNRGMIYEKIGQPEKAIADYYTTIALNPSSQEAFYNLGVLYGKAGLFEKALEKFNESLAINPNRADSYVNRGIVNALMGRREGALQDFNSALQIDQSNASAYFNRGKFYMTMGKRQLALADFQKACDLGDEGGCSAFQGQVP